jgi:hypothetical protein
MILRLLNPQGIAGLAASICHALLLIVQKGETRHWKKQSSQFEQLYRAGQSAFATTVADYRAATETVRAADRANAERVAAEQRAINERTRDEFEARLAAARAAADRLRGEGQGPADPRGRRDAAVPGLPIAAAGPAETAGESGFSLADRLTATEQAIQLDELIKWVKRQAAVDPAADPRSP